MAIEEEIMAVIYISIIIGFFIFYFYISYKSKKSRRVYIQECKDLYAQLLQEHKGLKTTDSHAVKHDYYRKLGYYPNLAGTYKNYKIYVQHTTGKGMMPNRTRFYIVHDKMIPYKLRLFHKEMSKIVSHLSKGEELELKGPTLTLYIANITPNSNFDENLLLSIIKRIDRVIIEGNPFYVLSLENFGMEVQYFGYVHERQGFIEILDSMVEIIDELAKRYPTIEMEEKEILKKIFISDSKYSVMELTPKQGRFISRKASKSFDYTKDDLLFIYEVDNQIELYFKNWKKIKINIVNKDKIDKLRAWLFLQN